MLTSYAFIADFSMGRGMVKNLVQKGNLSKAVLIQNRTRARSDKLAEALGQDKVQAVDSVQEAVSQSDIIFSCLGGQALARLLLVAYLTIFPSQSQETMLLYRRLLKQRPPLTSRASFL